MRILRVSLCIFAVALFSSVPASAQGATTPTSAKEKGAVTGIVTDQTGAVLPGATATITNGAGVAQTATTNDRGEYSLPGLSPGTYGLTISAPAFKDFHSDGLALVAGQSIAIDAVLEPAGTSTSVNVEGQKVSQVETETSQIVGNITQKELVSLGLNGRNFTQLIALTPGVSNQTGQDEAKVGILGSVRYSVNGGRVEYNSFNVDGGDVLNAGLNGNQSTLIVYPSLDALSEVQVLTSNYGAMYGQSASGTVLATTKSGTNQFHGVGYEFIRNEFFNARNYFDQTKEAPLYRRNDFGGTIGGPLYIPGVYNTNKDKTYFFFSEEFRYERTPTDFNQAVPSVAERGGNFSDVCPLVLPGFQTDFTRSAYPDCPAFGTDQNTGKPETFPGNQVPIDPNAQSILGTNIIPAPTSTTGCTSTIGSCFDATVSPSTYWREELFRIDQNINSKTRASFRYIHDSWDTTILSPQWGVVQNSFPTIQSTFTGPGISMLAHLTNTISPTLLNEFGFSYTTDHINLQNIDANGVQWQRPAGLTAGYLFNNGFGGKVPGVVIGGTNAAYGGFGFGVDPGYLPWHHSNPTYSFGDGVSKVLGKHNLQFGVQFVIFQRNELNQAVGANSGDQQGILTFSNVSSFNTKGNAFADFLLGAPTGTAGILEGGVKTFQQDSTQQNYYNRYQIAEPYFQDDWRATSKLTLNLGLRVSLYGNWHEKYNNVYNWVPSVYSPAVAAQATVDPFTGVLLNGPPSVCNPAGSLTSPCSPIPLNLNNLDPRITNGLQRCGVNGVPDGCMTSHLFNPAPRIGFAWDPWGDGKTSIRAGYGVFFHHGIGNEANTGSLEGSAPLVLDMTQNHPSSYECIGGVGQGCGASGAFPLNVTAIPTQSVWPYVQQWSFGVQRELTKNTVATLGYVGSKGTHLTTELQVNQLVPAVSTDNPFGPNGLAPGQPITTTLCNSYNGTSFTFVTPTNPGGTPWYNTNADFVNLQAACFGTPGKSFPDPNSLRTFAPGLGQIFSLQNVADSNYNGLQATLRRNTGPLTLGVSYTYSHSIDDSSDRSDTTLVNSFNLSSNKASSNFDQRHLLNISYVYKLDSFVNKLRYWFSDIGYDDSAPKSVPLPENPSSWTRAWEDGWEISGITLFQTGTPFSVINGGSSTGISVLDNAGVANGTGAGSYPDVIGNPHQAAPFGGNNYQSIGPILANPAAFGAPIGLTFGNAGRNFMNNPSRLNFDVALLKHFKITEGSNLEFRAEAFNVFNHTQFRIYDPDKGNTGSNTITCYGGPDNSAGDPSCLAGNSFLHPVDAHRPRTMQFGLKYNF
ncbi:MAG TPA: carboxypeptidase regulatory-like domain-containing protein [Terriglobales bacterium]|nr:carboxypeptidase regulatory-like domain-containing protein [Terriglobales bacterium]